MIRIRLSSRLVISALRAQGCRAVFLPEDRASADLAERRAQRKNRRQSAPSETRKISANFRKEFGKSAAKAGGDRTSQQDDGVTGSVFFCVGPKSKFGTDSGQQWCRRQHTREIFSFSLCINHYTFGSTFIALFSSTSPALEAVLQNLSLPPGPGIESRAKWLCKWIRKTCVMLDFTNEDFSSFCAVKEKQN